MQFTGYYAGYGMVARPQYGAMQIPQQHMPQQHQMNQRMQQQQQMQFPPGFQPGRQQPTASQQTPAMAMPAGAPAGQAGPGTQPSQGGLRQAPQFAQGAARGHSVQGMLASGGRAVMSAQGVVNGPGQQMMPASTNNRTAKARTPQAQATPPRIVPAGANQRSAPALAPTQQTQATPSTFSGGAQGLGDRRHYPLEMWVVRHGETIENHTRTIAGQNSSGLTARGQQQAELLSQRLQDIHFEGVYISDLVRTKQTADAVLRAMGPGVLAFTDSRLREKAAGQFEGFQIGYIEHMTRASGQAHRVFRPPGGESWEDVANRSRSFMREMLQKYLVCCDAQGRPIHRAHDPTGRMTPMSGGYACASLPVETKRVLIVTHGGFISEFLSSAVGGVPNCAKNCSIFVLGCARDNPQAHAQFSLKSANDVEHLQPLLELGVEMPGPETVTETAENQLDIEDDDEVEEDELDPVQKESPVCTQTPEISYESQLAVAEIDARAAKAMEDAIDGLERTVRAAGLGSGPRPLVNKESGGVRNSAAGNGAACVHRNNAEKGPPPQFLPGVDHVQC